MQEIYSYIQICFLIFKYNQKYHDQVYILKYQVHSIHAFIGSVNKKYPKELGYIISNIEYVFIDTAYVIVPQTFLSRWPKLELTQSSSQRAPVLFAFGCGFLLLFVLKTTCHRY